MPLTVAIADKMRAIARRVHCRPRGCREICANQKVRQPSDRIPNRLIESQPNWSWYSIRSRSHPARTAQAETRPNMDWRDHCQLGERVMEADSPAGERTIPLTTRLETEVFPLRPPRLCVMLAVSEGASRRGAESAERRCQFYTGRLEAYPTSGLRHRRPEAQVFVPDLFTMVLQAEEAGGAAAFDLGEVGV